MIHDAYERIHGLYDADWVLTCEHASQRLPEPYAWSDEERALLGTHWALDLGAEALTRGLAAELEAPAVLARFSRLLLDPNRTPDDPTLFRSRCDEVFLELNAGLAPEERLERLQRFHEPFHGAIDAMVGKHPHADVLSLHSFTPVYEGGPSRTMELGVLFDGEEALAAAFATVLEGEGFVVALNEPYSGKGGLMYSADRHAIAHGRRAIEIEVRQDLASDPAQQPRIVAALAWAARATARRRGA